MNDLDIIDKSITLFFTLMFSVDICSNYYYIKYKGRNILAPVLLVLGVIGIITSLSCLIMVVTTMDLIVIGGML